MPSPQLESTMAHRIRNILFLCTGNICRSPFAEGLLKRLLRQKGLSGFGVDSAGLLALPGNSATAMAQRVAAEHDVGLSDHTAQSVSEELVAWCDLVLVMEKSHEQNLLSAFPGANGKVLLLRFFARQGSRRRGIADPYGLRYEAYRFCFLDIEEAVCGLLEFLAGDAKVFEPIRVRCYEGFKANESPRSFEWAHRTHEISEIIDRWYEGGPEGRSQVVDYFKVQTHDGLVHIIRYDRIRDTWGIML